jgi:hypothetical protein
MIWGLTFIKEACKYLVIQLTTVCQDKLSSGITIMTANVAIPCTLFSSNISEV